MIGWPIVFLYEKAAMVRTFDRMRVRCRSIGAERSRQSG
jgi:hypothetical protein